MHVFHVKLTPAQAKKLVKGKVVQLKNSALLGNSGEGNWLSLHPHTYKKAMSAKKHGRGIRFQLTPEEIQASGEGLWDLIKKGAKWVGKQYKKHVKPVVAPILREGVKDVLSLGEAALGAVAPEAIPFLGMADQHKGKLVDWVGKRTGAYGLHGGYAGPLLPVGHPAMNPLSDSYPGMRCPNCNYGGYIGGQWMPTGGSFRGP